MQLSWVQLKLCTFYPAAWWLVVLFKTSTNPGLQSITVNIIITAEYTSKNSELKTQTISGLQLKHSNLITLNYCVHINHIIIHIITNTASFFNNSIMALIVGRKFHTISLHIMCNPQYIDPRRLKLMLHMETKSSSAQRPKKAFGEILFLLNSPSLKITQHWQKVEGWDIYLVLQGTHGKMNSLQKNTEFFSIPLKSFQVLFPHWRTFFSLRCHEGLILLSHIGSKPVGHNPLRTHSKGTSENYWQYTMDLFLMCCHGVTGLCLLMGQFSIKNKLDTIPFII